MAKREKVEKTENVQAAANSLLTKDLVKKFGDVIMDVDTMVSNEHGTLTSILSFDIATNGGIPIGSNMLITSGPGTGKTTLLLSIIAQAQKQGFKAYFADVEARLQSALLKTIPSMSLTDEDEKNGLGPKLEVIRSTEGNVLTAEKFLEIIIRLMQEQKRTIIIVDSIAALSPESDQMAEVSDPSKLGNVQKLLYKVLRGMAQQLVVNGNILMCVSHQQAKIGGYGGKPTTFGGNAPQYFATTSIVSYSTAKPYPEQGEPKIGQDTTFRIIKCGLGAPNKEFVIPIRYGFGVSLETDLFNVAEDAGKIAKLGSWYVFTNSKGEEIKQQGKETMIEWLKANPDEAKILENELRELLITTKK
jgi:recombination protein RecA